MQCPKCGGTDVSVSMESVKSSSKEKRPNPLITIPYGCLRSIIGFCTLGIGFKIMPKYLRSSVSTKNKMQKFCVCQDCGYSWKM